LNFVPFFTGIKNAPLRFHRINQGFIPMSILRGALQGERGFFFFAINQYIDNGITIYEVNRCKKVGRE
ncbi:hypothetical protein ACTP13_24855, partial [Paenibacillus peoriae]|uniref:hypothetical protein n=1 Tax=Paenibacillus peoriae TaxID=59893 RepID=UPI003F9782D9